MFILDTNVVSELKQNKKADKNVAAWALAHPSSDYFISAITILELEIGARRAERKDIPKALHLRHWIDDYVLPHFAGRVLPIDPEIALCCAKLHVPDPQSDRDAFIAATALVHRMTVVTRNTKDFAGTGVKLLNPWNLVS